MDNPQPTGSTGPMWWGIAIALAYLIAVTISFNLVHG